MPHDGGRIAWFSPEPRAIIEVDRFAASRSLRRSTRRFTVTHDRCFAEVVEACANPERPNGWITSEFVEAYTRLHSIGWAHSIEAWDHSGELAGGLYGVSIGGLFAGESMFHRVTDASKVALVHLIDLLRRCQDAVLDVQWLTGHLAALGAIEIARSSYLDRLAIALADPTDPFVPDTADLGDRP